MSDDDDSFQDEAIFQDVPADIDETWQDAVLVGGMADLLPRRRGALAGWYKRAGDVLLDAALETESTADLIYPVLFNYRHAIELYLKAIVEPAERNHKLDDLISQFQRVVLERLKVRVPDWHVRRLAEFHDVDDRSTAFRYAESGVVSKSGRFQAEALVRLRVLKRTMDRLAADFMRVIAALSR